MQRPFDLKRLLRPRSIAVVGGNSALNVLLQCQRMGYEGQLWPIHPTRTEMAGLSVYRSIADLPTAPDACFVGVNRQLTAQIIAALAAKDAGGAICYASGFREADAEGERLEAELQAVATIPVLGPNCYGLINYIDGVALWPDQHGGKRLAAQQTGVALLAQSSNLAINLTMQQRGLPVAYVLTAGNQMQIGLSDLALAVLDDPRVTALGLHIEGFDSIAGFEALARKARFLHKPVVVLKVGKTSQAQQAALTHTASLAGSQAASTAFLKRLGFGQVDSIAAFLETLKLLHVHASLSTYSLSSLSCSGGEASLIADAAVNRKVYFPTLTPEQKAPIEAVLGPTVTVNNPLDYQTYVWGDEPAMTAAFTHLLKIGFGLSLLILDFPHPERCQHDDWLIALRALEAAVQTTGQKAALVASLPENLPEVYVERLAFQGIAALSGFDEAIIAAEIAAEIGAYWQQAEAQPLIHPAVSTLSAQTFLSAQTLDEATAKAFLAQAGVSIPRGQTVQSLEEALAVAEQLNYPLVLKALGIAHKTEQQAVCLNLQNAAALSQAFADIKDLGSGLYLEQMIKAGVAELLVGFHRDPRLGLVMTLGLGGIWVELFRDSQTLLLPSSESEIKQALFSLKAAPLLQAYRGKPPADLDAALAAIMSIQAFVLNNAAAIHELDINPLMVCASGQGAYAVDALLSMALSEEQNHD
ncbi:acetate--CoA ligase family protein [Thiolinea disciformis]|uniref:acetate--CoA ligase family protein n=1 Tax=Thiolinea disciformis TaxID=125614 RepID=UPI00035E3011|nr:acetate--CoA ligase family protein [Thiolinea disciformis]